jgi:hypothetical protein
MQHETITGQEEPWGESTGHYGSAVQDLHTIPAWRLLRLQAIVRFVAAALLLLLEVWLAAPRASQDVAVFLRRPRSISSAELTSILDRKTVKSWGYVALPTLPATDLNVGNPKFVEEPTGLRYLFVGKRVLPIAADPAKPLSTVGTLERLPDSQRKAALTETLRVGLVDVLPNHRLDTRSSVYETARAKVVGGLFALFLTLFAIVGAVRSIRNPLRSFPGNAQQREALLREASPLILSTPKGKKLLYEKHLVFRGWFTVKVVALQDILWIRERLHWGMARLDIRTTSGAVLVPVSRGSQLGPFVVALRKVNPIVNVGGHPRLEQLWLRNRAGLVERFRQNQNRSSQTIAEEIATLGWSSNSSFVAYTDGLAPEFSGRSKFSRAADWFRSRRNPTVSSRFPSFVKAGIASSVLIAAALQLPAQANIATATSRPKSWSKTIQPLAEFVENIRGAPCLHPVRVDLLPFETYDLVAGNTKAAEAATQCSTGPRSCPKDWRRLTFTLLGMEPSIQSAEADHLSDSGGVYFSDEKRLYVRGTQLTVKLRAVVVHELTHAWQDQQFDFGKKRAITSLDSLQAWKALVEGDATFVGELYSSQQQPSDDPDPETSIVLSSYDQSTLASQAFRYTAGQIYVKRLRESVGNQTLDAAFQNPPVRISEVLTGTVEQQPILPIKIKPPFYGTVHYEENLDALSFFSLIGQDQQLRINDHIDTYQGAVVRLVEAGDQLCAQIVVRKPSGASWELPASLGERDGPLARKSCRKIADVESTRNKSPLEKRRPVSSIQSAVGRWSVASSFGHLSTTIVSSDTCFADKVVDTVDGRGGPSLERSGISRVTYDEMISFGRACGMPRNAIEQYVAR